MCLHLSIITPLFPKCYLVPKVDCFAFCSILILLQLIITNQNILCNNLRPKHNVLKSTPACKDLWWSSCFVHGVITHPSSFKQSQNMSLILPSALMCPCADKWKVWKVRLTSIQGVREEDACCPNQPDSVQQQDFLSKHFLLRSLPHSTWQSFLEPFLMMGH